MCYKFRFQVDSTCGLVVEGFGLQFWLCYKGVISLFGGSRFLCGSGMGFF